jgi:hypothetical protein
MKSKEQKVKPDPLGRKSRPTMLSKTEDFPELCTNFRRNWNSPVHKNGGGKSFLKIGFFLSTNFKNIKAMKKFRLTTKN